MIQMKYARHYEMPNVLCISILKLARMTNKKECLMIDINIRSTAKYCV